MAREVANQMWEALWSDVFPDNMACLVDFGLDPMTLGSADPTQRFGALQWAVKHGGVTLQELDAALGDGPALTKLVDQEDNPYRCEFTTAWDGMVDPDE